MSINAKTRITCYQISSAVLIDNLGPEYKTIILKSIVRDAFCQSNLLNILNNESYINTIYDQSENKLYEDGEIVMTPSIGKTKEEEFATKKLFFFDKLVLHFISLYYII